MECLCKIKDVFKKIHQFEQRLNGDYNVTINEAMVVCSLSDAKKSSGEVSLDTGISTSRTSRVLLSLEKKRYVERSFCEDDKRKMMFVLTSLGQEKLTDINGLEVDLDVNL